MITHTALYAASSISILVSILVYALGVKVLANYRERVCAIHGLHVFSFKEFKNNYFVRQIWLVAVLNTVSMIFIVLLISDLHTIEKIANLQKYFWWKVFDILLGFSCALIYLEKLLDRRAR